MATYFTGSESPAASGGRGGGSSNNYLRNLSQLAESEGRSRYYDYLMEAPARADAKYERAKEDSREEWRLDLKTKAIVESINNRQHQNDYNALTGLLGVSNAKMSGANAVLASKLGAELDPSVQIDSQAIRSYTELWQTRNRELASDPTELASFTAALTTFASAQSASMRILNNLKGVGGARFDQSGNPLGIVPITTLKDFYVSEFGVDPITNIAIPKADKVAAPNEKDVEAAAKDVEETESALTKAGALDSVAEDKPVSDEWIKVAADWVAGTRQEVPQSELPGGTDQSGVYNPEEGEVTSRPLTRLEMLEMHGIAPREPQHTLLGRPLHPAGPDSFRAPEFPPSQEPSNLPEELTLDQRLNPQNYPDLNRDTSAGPLTATGSDYYETNGFGVGPWTDMSPDFASIYHDRREGVVDPSNIFSGVKPHYVQDDIGPLQEVSRTVLPEYLSGGYEGYEMGDGHMSGRISPEEMPTEVQLPPLPPNIQYSERAPEDLPNYPVEDNPDYLDELEMDKAYKLNRIQQETNQGLMQIEKEYNERLKGYMDEMNLRHGIMANTEKYANIAGLLGGIYGAGKWALTKGGPMALNYLRTMGTRGAPAAADDISNLAVEVGKRSRGFPARTPSYGSPHAIPPGARGRGFPFRAPPIQPMTNPPLAVPPALRGRGFPTP